MTLQYAHERGEYLDRDAVGVFRNAQSELCYVNLAVAYTGTSKGVPCLTASTTRITSTE